MNTRKKTLLGAAFAAALAGFGAAAQAQQFIVSIAPPAPRHEIVPAPRPGHIWAAGHYDWRDGRYVWVPGRWLSARNGYEYREPRWVQRGNGQWVRVGGNWERRGPYGDRDRDGIANRYDNRNDNRYARRTGPYGDLDRDGIRNRDDRDRDGDGVSNRRDRYPDNRRRS